MANIARKMSAKPMLSLWSMVMVSRSSTGGSSSLAVWRRTSSSTIKIRTFISRGNPTRAWKRRYHVLEKPNNSSMLIKYLNFRLRARDETLDLDAKEVAGRILELESGRDHLRLGGKANLGRTRTGSLSGHHPPGHRGRLLGRPSLRDLGGIGTTSFDVTSILVATVGAAILLCLYCFIARTSA